MRQAYIKLKKYELYFSEFYPATDKIRKIDALEHHTRAYLEDITVFKNKVNSFLGTLKNDLKKIALNKDEIDKAMVWMINQVEGVFDNV